VLSVLKVAILVCDCQRVCSMSVWGRVVARVTLTSTSSLWNGLEIRLVCEVHSCWPLDLEGQCHTVAEFAVETFFRDFIVVEARVCSFLSSPDTNELKVDRMRILADGDVNRVCAVEDRKGIFACMRFVYDEWLFESQSRGR